MRNNRYHTPMPVLLARARFLEQQLNRNTSDNADLHENLSTAQNQNEITVKPKGALMHFFDPVVEIFIAGGGGAGRALPQALQEAVNFGLNLKKIKVVCATSVGTILGLGIVLGLTPANMRKTLDDMPTDKFQDWSIRKIINFFNEWGLCSGKEMTSYIRKLIRETCSLDDPTFRELYNAGFTKEFRVIATNVSKQRIAIFSHKETPNMKVADAVATACGIPLVYPPHWLMNAKGEIEVFTDGGLIRNYPFGVGGSPNVPIEHQLGFNFVNRGTAYALNNEQHTWLGSFWGYLCALFSMILFQDPLSLSDGIKNRTVVIDVNHNPLKFNATAQEQRLLDAAGREGVRRLVQQNLKIKADEKYRKIKSDFLPSFSLKKPEIKKVSNIQEQRSLSALSKVKAR